MTTALVTGITGFLGRHLIGALAADGIEVAGLTRNSAFQTAGAKVFVGSITDREFVSGVVSQVRPDIVFHLAANKARTGNLEEFRSGLEDNLFGALNLVEACVEHTSLRTFVSIGTCEEYGNVHRSFDEGMRESPVSAYSLSKTSVTHLLQTLWRTHDFPAVVLRPSLAYGPGQATDMYLPALVETLLAGKRFAMSKGEQTRDFVFIADLIEALILAATEPEATGKVINISSGVPVTLREVAHLAAKQIGGSAKDLLDFGKIEYRTNEIMEYRADPALAEKILGWRPRTPLQDGLAATIEYFRSSSRKAANK